MGKYKHINYNNEMVLRKIPVDTDRLYGDIDTAIAYLKEIKSKYPSDVSLCENWTGYEDMEMCITFSEWETDQERDLRIELAEQKAEYEKEIAKKDAERAQKQKQYEQLKRELGYY